MPLYEYACPACGERLEKMKRMSDRVNGPECPTCGEQTELAMSTTGRVGAGNGSASSSVPASGGSCGPGFT